MTNPPDRAPATGVLGAVLAGGRSRRFGRDKTTEPIGGVPMGLRAVEVLRPVCDEVVVVSSRPQTPSDWAPVVPDRRPGAGPLAGIEAALHEAGRRGLARVFVLAADLPTVTTGIVESVLAELPAAGAGGGIGCRAVAVERSGHPPFEPLCAAYTTPCLAVASELLDRDERAAFALFEAVGGAVVALPPDQARAVALNVNEPGDLDEIE